LSLIGSFKLVPERPRAHKPPSVLQRRRRAANAVDIQINLAQAEETGQPFGIGRRRWIVSETTGKREPQWVTQTPPKWFWVDDGICYLEMRYGGTPIELAPNARVIEVGERAALVPTLRTLKAVIIGGELDAGIRAALGDRLKLGWDG